MAERPPLLQPPIAISGNDPAEIRPMIVEACRKSGPIVGAIGGAALGATFAYFAPKIFDHLLGAWRADGHGEPVEIEFEDGDE